MITTQYRTRVSGRGDCIYLVPIGDIHYGAKACDEKKLQALINWIAPRKNVYVLGMGDYIEAINYSDKRFDPTGVAPWIEGHLDRLVEYQIARLSKILTPIKGRIIGLLDGNHEETIRQRYHFSPVDVLAHNLETTRLTYTAMIKWIFERSTSRSSISMYATHFWGSSREPGPKINALVRLTRDYEADIYLGGHVHEKHGVVRERIYLSSKGEPKIFVKKKVFGITGTFLNTLGEGYSTYSEVKGYSPTPTGVLKIRIDPFVIRQDADFPPDIHISE
jgi:predicted phosphodiesterase